MNLFILDVNGALIDNPNFDCHLFFQAINQVTGIVFSDEDLDDYHHTTQIKFIENLLEKYELQKQRMLLVREAIKQYVINLKNYLLESTNQLLAKPGAVNFIKDMKTHPMIKLAIVSNGFDEITKLKLAAAGFDINSIAFASCSDAETKSEITALAAFRAKQDHCVTFTRRVYFGKADWDKMVTKSLGYEFITVGNELTQHTQIINFSHYPTIFGKLGLSDKLIVNH